MDEELHLEFDLVFLIWLGSVWNWRYDSHRDVCTDHIKYADTREMSDERFEQQPCVLLFSNKCIQVAISGLTIFQVGSEPN